MVNCSLCKIEGYKHIIDITGIHYDLTENTEPIYTSIHGKNFLCSDCMDKIERLPLKTEAIRTFLYSREAVVWGVENNTVTPK